MEQETNTWDLDRSLEDNSTLIRIGIVEDKLKQLVVGGSIGAFKTVSGFAGTLQVIQLFLGKVADTLEAVRNLLNFTVSCICEK